MYRHVLILSIPLKICQIHPDEVLNTVLLKNISNSKCNLLMPMLILIAFSNIIIAKCYIDKVPHIKLSCIENPYIEHSHLKHLRYINYSYVKCFYLKLSCVGHSHIEHLRHIENFHVEYLHIEYLPYNFKCRKHQEIKEIVAQRYNYKLRKRKEWLYTCALIDYCCVGYAAAGHFLTMCCHWCHCRLSLLIAFLSLVTVAYC